MNIFIDIILYVAYSVALYFSVFLLLVYIDNKNFFSNEESSTTPKKKPFVSILIPAYNEEKTIIKTLKSAYNLDYPKDKIEIIAIDDGSKDNTKKIISEYIQDKPNFKLISHENMGKAASLNKALQIAKGEFFACLDADSFVESLTLKKMLAFYYKEDNPNLAIITPAMKVSHPKTLLQKVQWLEYLVIILIARISSHLDLLHVAPGPFSLYRTDVIRKMGYFDEKNITEDQEIAYRIQKHNYQIKQCFDGYVYTTAPGKIKPFYQQRRRWYLGSLSCLHKYRQMVANKKYGDFGLMQMIKNVTGYILALTGILIAGYFIFLPFITKMKDLLLINFDFLTLLQNLKFSITYLDLLLLDIKKIFIIIFLFIVGFFFFYHAHKNAREKMSKFGLIPLIPYFAFYYLLKGTILILSLFEFARGKKIKW